MHEKKNLKGLHVLVVDDDTMNLLYFSHILMGWGASVDIAENGRLAIEKVCSVKYDLVLMDCLMPGIDGYDATRAIRAHGGGYFDNLPIYAFSTNPDPHKIAESRMNGSIVKPPEDMDELYNQIACHVKEDSF